MHARPAAAAAAAVLAAAAAAAAAAGAVPAAHADVWVDGAGRGGQDPAAFVGHDGAYRVVGVVKSTEDRPVAPTVTVTASGGGAAGGWSASRTLVLPSIPAGGEMPFRVAVPAAPGAAGDGPLRAAARIDGFVAGLHSEAPAGAAVVYDRTLRVHGNGTVTGRIANTGSEEIAGVLVVAVAHGRSHEVLDVVASDGPVGPIPPGGHAEFAMAPDPSVGPSVWYYSCFGLGDPGVITLSPTRNGEPFPLRYATGVLLSHPSFDESGETLSMRINPGWPLQTYINLEFPRHSDGEEFTVLLEGEPADALQSRDELGNWHVALTIEDQYAGMLTISGFAPGTTSADRRIEVPEWIRDDAAEWSLGRIDDSRFLDGIAFLAGGGAIDGGAAAAAAVGGEGKGRGPAVPHWVRDSAAWWSQGMVSDREFLSAVGYLLSIGAIRIA